MGNGHLVVSLHVARWCRDGEDATLSGSKSPRGLSRTVKATLDLGLILQRAGGMDGKLPT